MFLGCFRSNPYRVKAISFGFHTWIVAIELQALVLLVISKVALENGMRLEFGYIVFILLEA